MEPPPIVEIQATNKEISADYYNCVVVVRSFIPDLPRGDAIDFPVNTDFPSVGGVVKFQYGDGSKIIDWHIAYILVVTQTRMKIAEGWGGEYRERWVKLSDPEINGFWYPSTQSG